MPTSVFIIRHGDYLHRPSPQGTEASADLGLSAWGRAQAEALRQRLAGSGDIHADALFCSTLPRARQTAALIAPALGVGPEALAGLCEWESGNEAMDVASFQASFDALAPADRRHHRFHPGCETIAEFTQRVHGQLAQLLADHEGKSLVLVAHGGVLEAAHSFFQSTAPGPFEDAYPAPGHTAITHWHREDPRDAWALVFANDSRHLPAAGNVATA